MDSGVARLVVAAVLGAHGLGHVLGWLPAWGVAQFEGVSSRSWVLSPALGVDGARLVAGAAFLVPTAGFLMAAAGLLLGEPWWRQVAVGSAVASLLCTAVFPGAFPAGSTIGSVAVNVIVIVGIGLAGWGQNATA